MGHTEGRVRCGPRRGLCSKGAFGLEVVQISFYIW
jgi:hypothetical protein